MIYQGPENLLFIIEGSFSNSIEKVERLKSGCNVFKVLHPLHVPTFLDSFNFLVIIKKVWFVSLIPIQSESIFFHNFSASFVQFQQSCCSSFLFTYIITEKMLIFLLYQYKQKTLFSHIYINASFVPFQQYQNLLLFFIPHQRSTSFT